MFNINFQQIPQTVKTPTFKGKFPNNGDTNKLLSQVDKITRELVTIPASIGAASIFVSLTPTLHNQMNTENSKMLYQNQNSINNKNSDTAWENFVNNNEEISEYDFIQGKYGGDKTLYEKSEDKGAVKKSIVTRPPYFKDVYIDAYHDFDDYYYF